MLYTGVEECIVDGLTVRQKDHPQVLATFHFLDLSPPTNPAAVGSLQTIL